MKVHSAEWFQHKVAEAAHRIDHEWPQSMRANAVVASATLPCVDPILTDETWLHGDQAVRQAMSEHQG